MAVSCSTSTTRAVAATPSTLLTDFQLGWDSAAQGIEVLWGDGNFKFTPTASSLGIVIGLTPTILDDGYTDIQFAFYINKGKVLVMEHGVIKTSIASAPDVELTISRMQGVVTYLIGGTPFYTSTQTYTEPLLADVSLYSAGDAVLAASITPVQSSANDLLPLQTRGGVGANRGYALLQPLEVPVFIRCINQLAPLTTDAGEGTYARSTNYLQPLVTTVESGLIIPEYALSANSLPFLHTIATGITGVVGYGEANLSPAWALAADHVYGISVNNLPPLETLMGVAIPVDGVVIATLTDAYRLDASGTEGELSGVDATLPTSACVSYGGASMSGALPTCTLNIQGTIPAVGRVDATLPMPSLVSNGRVGGVSAVYGQTLGGYTVAAYGGGQAVSGLPHPYTVTATGIVGGIARVTEALPSGYGLSAHISSESYGRVQAEFPSLATAPSGTAWLVGPSLNAHIVGHSVVAVTYEAYAINLSTGAVSRYTNYPFNNVIRLGNTFLGVSDTGLFALGGGTDITEAIDCYAKTFNTNFDNPNFKRLPYVYASGRADGGVEIEVQADEGTTYSYESDWGEVPETSNHRTTVGKGIRGAYYSIGIRNVSGGTLELDGLYAHVAPTERAV